MKKKNDFEIDYLFFSRYLLFRCILHVRHVTRSNNLSRFIYKPSSPLRDKFLNKYLRDAWTRSKHLFFPREQMRIRKQFITNVFIDIVD